MEKIKPHLIKQKDKLKFKTSKKSVILEDIKEAVSEIKEANAKGIELQKFSDFLNECED